MRQLLLVSACGVALGATATSASAAGSYLALIAGGAWTTGATYDEPRHNPPGYLPLPLGQGFQGSAALGLLFGAGMRFEGEFSYRGHGVHQTTGFEGTLAGNARIFGAMANFWMDLHPKGDFTPYIGGGIGVANVHFGFTNTEDAPEGYVNKSDTVFAYQLGAGFAIAAGDHVKLTLDYRFYGTASVDVPANLAPFGVKGSLKSHSIMGGLRISLGK